MLSYSSSSITRIFKFYFRLLLAVLHENLTRFGYPNIGCLLSTNHCFVFGSPGYPLPNTPLNSMSYKKSTYFLWKLPVVNYTVSVNLGTDTCCTNSLVFWVCFWFNCYFIDDSWILLQIWLQKCCVFLSITNCIGINIFYFKSLLECSFTQLKSCIMWQFI